MTLRNKLIDIALQWQESFGVAPSITSALSEYDAAMLVGMSENEYSEYMKDKTAVSKGADFVFNNIRYQVKANRPSGKKGSFVTMVPKASNYVVPGLPQLRQRLVDDLDSLMPPLPIEQLPCLVQQLRRRQHRQESKY